MSLAKKVDFLRRVSKLSHLNGFGVYGRSQTHGLRSPLVRVKDFGANPGGLKMFSYVPANLPRKPALVVVLHGCGQSASGYDFGTGWSTLACALVRMVPPAISETVRAVQPVGPSPGRRP